MPDKGYVEEAHPLLYFFLNILGFNFCLRDGTDRYKNNYCGYFVVVINSGILLYQIVFEFTYLLSEGTDASVYQMKLSTCCHITSCIYLMSCSYDSLRNRTIIIKYLNAIGPQYKKTFNSIQRSNEYTLLSMYAITIILAYSLVANVASILIMLLTWAPFVNFVPSVLDYQYYTLAEHLIHSYRSISRDIRQVIQTNNAALKGLAPSVVKHYNAESSDISKLRQRGPNTRDGNHSIHCVLFDSRLNDVTSQHVLSRVRKIMKLAALFTKMYFVRSIFRSSVFLIKFTVLFFMLSYTVTQTFDFSLVLMISILLLDEALRFSSFCSTADRLKAQNLQLEEALLQLYGLPFQSPNLRAKAHSLALLVKARPAVVDAGGVAHLGRGALFTLLNVALTFSAICYQYSPDPISTDNRTQ